MEICVSEMKHTPLQAIQQHNSGQHLAFPACPSHSTHIYPLQVTAGNRGRNNSIVSVDDRNYVHPQQLMERAIQVATLLLIMKIQVGDQNLQEWKIKEETEVTFLMTVFSSD